MKKLAVLSRYKENDVFWPEYLQKNGYDILIFNKFAGENLLPNVGRESHTFIHYIINNYDNLPDEILFSQFSPMDHFNNSCCNIYNNPNKYRGILYIDYFLHSYLYDFIGIRPTDYESKIRNRYIDWYKFYNNFFEECNYEFLSKVVAAGCTINGVFRTTKYAILKNNINLYKKAIKLLEYSIDPYEGYCFERIWKFLFTKYGDIDNNKYNIFNNRLFLFGTPSNKTTGRHQQVKNGAYGHIKLSEDGTITTNKISYYSNYNESFWRISDHNLHIFSADGCLTSKYDISKYDISNIDDSIFQGDFYTHKGISNKHFWLKPILFKQK